MHHPTAPADRWPPTGFRFVLALLLLSFTVAVTPGRAQSSPAYLTIPRGTPRSWADSGAANQLRIIEENSAVPLRYRMHRTDASGSMTREVIESREGNVARLLDRNGAPLTPEENSAERERLEDILQSPSAFLRRQERERNSREYALELVRALPTAMIWSYAPAQLQASNGAQRPQVVLDFAPDPHFKPPTLLTEALTGISGRVWIDAQTRCVTRIEGHILRPVDIGWGGILMRVLPGGTIAFEQTEAGPQRWVYSHLSEHLTVREVLVHTVRENTELEASNFQVLPAPVSYREAIHALLAMQVPTR